MAVSFLLVLIMCLTPAAPNTYLVENFEAPHSFSSRWTTSTAIPAPQQGSFQMVQNALTSTKDHGLQTSESLRYYAISRPLTSDFHNLGKTLIVQYSVRFEQLQETLCAGGYIKLFAKDFNPESFDGDTKYALMFGPDMCGGPKIHFYATAEQHIALSEDNGHVYTSDRNDRNDRNDRSSATSTSFRSATLPMKRTIDYGISATERKRSHIYTLIVHGSDNSWEILIDDVSYERGNMTNSFDFLPPLHVLDKEANKPSDWVDNEMIPVGKGKPLHYDDIPRRIPNPMAEQPILWDEYEDGEWIPPLIPNPAWNGEWEQTFVKNNNYMGAWERPYIQNPLFHGKDAEQKVRDLHYVCNPCTHVGFEVFQQNHGTVFDDVLITDSISEAERGRAMFLRKSKEEMWSQYKREKEMLELEDNEDNEKEEQEKKEEEEEEEEDEEIDLVEEGTGGIGEEQQREKSGGQTRPTRLPFASRTYVPPKVTSASAVSDLLQQMKKSNTVTIENADAPTPQQLQRQKEATMEAVAKENKKEDNHMEELYEAAVQEALLDNNVLPGFRAAEDDEVVKARNDERTTVNKVGNAADDEVPVSEL
jgi:calreticulin